MKDDNGETMVILKAFISSVMIKFLITRIIYPIAALITRALLKKKMGDTAIVNTPKDKAC